MKQMTSHQFSSSIYWDSLVSQMSSHQFSSSIYWDSLFFSHTNKQKQCRDDIYRTQKSSTIGVPITPGAVPKKTVCDGCGCDEEWQLNQTLCCHYTCKVCMGGSKRKRGRLLEKRLRERQQRNDKLKLVPFSFLISHFSFLCTIKLFELFHLVSISSMSISLSLF